VDHGSHPNADVGQGAHRRFLEENHARIANVAREGYLEHGRGAIFIFEDTILDALDGGAPTVTIEYVSDGGTALERRGGWPTEEHGRLVQTYDPDTSMVVLVGRRRNGREIFTYHMLFAEQETDVVPLRDFFG